MEENEKMKETAAQEETENAEISAQETDAENAEVSAQEAETGDPADNAQEAENAGEAGSADDEECGDEEKKEKKGFFARLMEGLAKTRDSFRKSFNALFSGFSQIDDDFYDELEELLITSDIGVETTMKIIDDLKEKVKAQHIKKP